MIIVKETPPVATRGAAHHNDGVADALRRDPGEWYRIYEYTKPTTAAATAQNIRKGQRGGFAVGQYEAAARTLDGKGVVYARFVGQS